MYVGVLCRSLFASLYLILQNALAKGVLFTKCFGSQLLASSVVCTFRMTPFPAPPFPAPPFSSAVPPNITMQPVAVTPDEATARCCAGVRVFLEDPSDPTLVFTAQVSTEGSPFIARNVTREGDVVYVQGLQAGTPYNIRLTGRNQFGSVTKEVSTTPLIGEMVCFV